jgi:large subunit ribosomal protein L3
MLRSGLLAKKLGMTQVYDDAGNHIPVTVLSLEGCQVVASKTIARDGYTSLQLGAGDAKPKRVSKAERERFAKAGVTPKRKCVEFRIAEGNEIEVGATMTADHFVPGQKIDAAGITVGKGFAGAMKRHNFGGLRATHGVSISHRSHGSTGQCQDPGKVFKGKKMAGHMGAVRRTVQNLEVARVDAEQGLVMIKGATPGAKGAWIELRDATKGTKVDDLPLPGKFTMEAPKPKASASKKKSDKKPAASKADFVDAVVLIDGIGPKGEEALAEAGITKLTQIAAMTAADITAIEEKIGKPGVVAKQEWVEQANEMINGEEPRSQVDKDLAKKMRADAAKGEEE